MGHTFGYHYDKARRLVGLTNENGARYRFAYDVLDRLIAESGFDHKLTGYRYNAGNELVEQREFGDDASLAAKLMAQLGGRPVPKKDATPLSDDLDNQTRFVWDGSHLLQEIHPDGRYTYIYTDQNSHEPLAQVRDWTTVEGENRQQIHYFHCDQIGIPREMTDKDGNLLWFGNYTGWGRLKEETKVTDSAYQPFRLQNQYADRETGLHYNFFRYYEPDAGRFVNQDPIGLWGGDNLYRFAPNTQSWVDFLGLFTLEQLLTVGIGPFEEGSIPARGPERNFTQEERKKLNKIGVCHTCGATNPGTKTGNFVGDHQPNTGLLRGNESQDLYPQCLKCSQIQKEG